MAKGDFVRFDDFFSWMLSDSEYTSTTDDRIFDTHDIAIALLTPAVTPTAATNLPSWAGGVSTTEFYLNEVAAGGNYFTNGVVLTGPTSVTNNGGGSFDVQISDGTPILWEKHASNPTNARWAVVYVDTDSNTPALGFIDLGVTFDMTTGDLEITIPASVTFNISNV